MQLVIHHEILRTRICLIPRRTHLLICVEYIYLKSLFKGSGRKEVIAKMAGFQLEDSFLQF